MKLLLDTCTLLWLTRGTDDLSERARLAIVDPKNELVLSCVSAWEIACKAAIGGLTFDRPVEEWISDVREEYGLAKLAVDDEAALLLVRLPKLHRDPFDRMLVAQSIVHGMALVTPDRDIARYPGRTLW